MRGTLRDIELPGGACFLEEEQAGFAVDSHRLPGAWEYILQNGDVLLRVDQRGPSYAQSDPPGGLILFRREGWDPLPCWHLWVADQAASFRPFSSLLFPGCEPDAFRATYTPQKITYELEQHGVRCISEFAVPTHQPVLAVSFRVVNARSDRLDLRLTPVLKPYFNAARLDPWDRPEWYLRSAFCRGERTGFWTRLMNMQADPSKRANLAFWSDGPALTSAELSYERFVGQGGWDKPDRIMYDSLRLPPDSGKPWGVEGDRNVLFGYPPVYALQYAVSLAPGEEARIGQAVAVTPHGPDFGLTPEREAVAYSVYTEPETFAGMVRERRDFYGHEASLRGVETGDPAFDRYVNEWIPLQLDWVCSLDRGWPSGMRGVRDAAQDFTALAPLHPDRALETLCFLLSCQRADGWFPRQVSTRGREGEHDLREYVDAGCWVIELAYEYLCLTKNFAALDTPLPWLDRDGRSPLIDHLIAATNYYITPENIGEHGLCKIRSGDWLDGLNRAGLEGRGESVMTTAQAVMSIEYLLQILRRLDGRRYGEDIARYEQAKDRFRGSLLDHAFNEEGFFNGCFSDAGYWVFSNHDPDGVSRFYGPANWYAILSGAARGATADAVLDHLDDIRCDRGYRLYWPPLGEPPIARAGRIATGDQPAGLWENGNVYNHGAQCFLARAAAAAGRGDLVLDALRYAMPYDQERHPAEKTGTPPYAIVNCWQEVPGFVHRGGHPFLTGAVGVISRVVYNWMFGLRPTLDGLRIDPCLPREFVRPRVKIPYRDSTLSVTVDHSGGRARGMPTVTLNGRPVERFEPDPFHGRETAVIDDKALTSCRDHIIAVTV